MAWSEEDQDAALEWQEYQDSLCPGCGHPRHETFGPENRDKFDAEAHQCHACEVKQRKQRIWTQDENYDSDGIYIVAVEED